MKRKIVIAAVTAAVLIGGGAATAVALADDDGHDRGDRSATATGTASGTTARTTVGDAVAAAVAAVPGTVTEAELDDEDGGLVWELDVYGSDRAWHDVTVDAGDGEVLGKRVDHDDDRDRHAPRKTSVPLDEAVLAALKSVPGTVTSIELDGHDGRRGGATHWEVDVRGKDAKEHELRVDAGTGTVTVDRSSDGDRGDDD